MYQQRIGFVGAGQMARALASGMVNSGLIAEDKILASDPDDSACQNFLNQIPKAGLGKTNEGILVLYADV